MKKYFIFIILAVFFTQTKIVIAQSTLSLTCTNTYIESNWTGGCDKPGYCEPNNSYKEGENYCLSALDFNDCPTYQQVYDWEEGAAYCQTSSGDNFCCNLSSETLVGADVPIEDQILCDDSAIQQTMYGAANLTEALEAGQCRQLARMEDFVDPTCDPEHRCVVNNTSYYCCGGYVAPGEDPPIVTNPSNSFKGCNNIDSLSERRECNNCLYENGELTGAVWTELGCIDPSPSGLITRIFQIGLGIMGGIAILRFIQIAILYQSGDAQKIQDARDAVVSLIAGIILLSLGVVILQFLGVNILGLPEGFLGVQ